MEDGSATGILSLPVELLHFIFDLLPCEDVLSTRQSCQQLANVGAEHMLEEIVAVYKRDRFQRLLQIAQHPVLRHRVQSFHFQAESFDAKPMIYKEWNLKREDQRARGDDPFTAYEPDFLGYHEAGGWLGSKRAQRAFDRSFKRWQRLRKGSHKPAELKAAYARYVDTVEDHQKIALEGFDLLCLAELFRSCPKLQHVELTTGCGTKGWIDASRLAWKDIMLTPAVYGETLDQGVHQLFTMIIALRKAKRDIKTLSVMEATYRILQPPPTVMSDFLDVMKTLHEFRLAMTCCNEELEADELNGRLRWEVIDDADEELQECVDNDVLPRLLDAATELRVLKLHMCSGSEGEPAARIEKFLPGRTWSHLKEVGLAEIEASEDDLVELVLRHRDTLERLSLAHINLYEGDWDSVFRRIAGKLPKLRRVKLRHHFTEWGDEVFDFDVGGLETTRVHMLRDAIENMILNGGELPDYDAIEADLNNWKYPWELDNYLPPHKDGEEIYDDKLVEIGVEERVSAKFDDIL